MFIRLHTMWAASGRANRRGMERAIEVSNSKSCQNYHQACFLSWPERIATTIISFARREMLAEYIPTW